METNDTNKDISAALSKAIDCLKTEYKGSSLTDIYLIVDIDSNELSLYDDEENLLTQAVIEAWNDIDNQDEIVRQLRIVVEDFDLNNKFDALDIYKPFSVNIADENFTVQEELLVIIDDEIIRIENDFLDKIDKEFDDFLDKLLKE